MSNGNTAPPGEGVGPPFPAGRYDFKLIPEAIRAGGFALIVFIVTLGIGFDLDVILGDWKPWATSAISGGVAAFAAGTLSVLTRNKTP